MAVEARNAALYQTLGSVFVSGDIDNLKINDGAVKWWWL